MNYVLDLFTPMTWSAFQRNGSTISGFAKTQSTRAAKVVKRGDIFLCYMVRLSRWCGALEVLDGPYEDNTPLFKQFEDPFVIRFRVKPLVILNDDLSIPITD